MSLPSPCRRTATAIALSATLATTLTTLALIATAQPASPGTSPALHRP